MPNCTSGLIIEDIQSMFIFVLGKRNFMIIDTYCIHSSVCRVCLFFCVHTVQGGKGGLRYICYYRFHSLSASTRRCLFFFQDLKRKLKVLLVEKEYCVRLLHIWARPTHPPPYSCNWELGQFHQQLWTISLDFPT